MQRVKQIFPEIVGVMYFQAQKRGQKENNKSVEQTRKQAMATDNVTTMQLENLDENINIDLQNTENGSQNVWTKGLRD